MLDYYRIYILEKDYIRFCHLLLTIRPDESKVHRIDPGSVTTRIDVTLSEEELVFLKLAIPGLRESWIQEWTDANN